MDLLAFGASDKPILEYTVDLWRDLVVDFLAEFVEGPAVLVGNSLGSLIALAVSPAVHSRSADGACVSHLAGESALQCMDLLPAARAPLGDL